MGPSCGASTCRAMTTTLLGDTTTIGMKGSGFSCSSLLSGAGCCGAPGTWAGADSFMIQAPKMSLVIYGYPTVGICTYFKRQKHLPFTFVTLPRLLTSAHAVAQHSTRKTEITAVAHTPSCPCKHSYQSYTESVQQRLHAERFMYRYASYLMSSLQTYDGEKWIDCWTRSLGACSACCAGVCTNVLRMDSKCQKNEKCCLKMNTHKTCGKNGILISSEGITSCVHNTTTCGMHS